MITALVTRLLITGFRDTPVRPSLTHLSLASFLANNIAPDATPQNAASHLELFYSHREISSRNEIKKIKTIPDIPKNESGLSQMIMMGESIRQIWVNNHLYSLPHNEIPMTI